MILALDVSSKCTGWSKYSRCGEMLHYGSFKPRDLADFYAQLLVLIDQCDEVVCEEIYMGPNKQTFKVLAGLQAIVRLVGQQNGIPVTFISAVEWRKALGWPKLKRDAAKARAIATVLELHNIKVTDDEAEALLLGKVYTGDL